MFLPILTVARELDSRLLLASRLCRNGHVVYLGLTRTLTAVARESPPSIYVTPLLNPGPEKRLREIKALGHWMAGWDEEGLVYPSGEWYRTNRVGAGTIALLDLLMAWGPQQRADLKSVLGEEGAPGPRVAALGNPRADMLRAPYRSIVDEQAAELRSRHGPFILINTNFDLINHKDGAANFHRRLHKGGYFSEAEGSERLARWIAYRSFMFTTFLAGIPGFLTRLQDRKVILRPHPSEDLAPWEELAARSGRLEIAPPTASVLPWLAAADYLIHSSCTTAVEAVALGTRTIAIHPPGADTTAESPLPNKLSLQVRDWDEAASAILAGAGVLQCWQQQLLGRYIARFPDQHAIAHIAQHFETAGRRLAPAHMIDESLFAQDGIGMVTTLKDENSRFPPFDDALIAHMHKVLASSPHGAPRLRRVNDYAVALDGVGMASSGANDSAESVAQATPATLAA